MTHRPLAAIALALAAIAGCGGGGGGDKGDGPLRVALFINNLYVDYNVADVNAEASNLETALKGGAALYGQATLSGLGLDVTAFSAYDQGSLAASLAGHRVLIVPELEIASIAAQLPFETITLLRDYVGGGGTLIVFRPEPNTIALVDAILGTALQATPISPSDDLALLDAAGAAGTPFQGGPASIETNDWTWLLASASLPANAKKIYTYGGEPVVTVLPKGAGQIVVMGWDWFVDFVSETPDVAGWLEAVKRATQL